MVFKMRSINGKLVKVGEIRGLVFFKHIEFSKHHYRKADALGIDVKLLQAIQAKGVVRVVLIDDESGRRFEAPVERFLQKGWDYPKKGDQHYGKFQPQRFMALNRWTIVTRDHLVLQDGKKMEYEEAEARKKAIEYEQREHKRAIRKAEIDQAQLSIPNYG